MLEEATGSAAGELLVLKSAGNDVKDATDKAETTTGEFADAIERVKDESKPGATSVEGFGDKTETTAGQADNAAVKTNEFADAIERLEKLSRNAGDEVVDFEKELKDFQKAVENSELTSSDFNAALRKMVADMTGVKDTSEDLENEITLLEAALEKMNERFDASDPLIRDLNKRLEEAKAELEAVIDPTKKLTTAQQELLDTINGLTPEVKAAHEEIADLNVLYEKGLITVGEFRERTDKLAESLKDTGSGAEDAEKQLSDFLKKVGEGNADLSDLATILVGEDGVKSAIEGCFGTGPVTAFDGAVKSLFPTFTEFEGILGSLTGALDGFFSGGELKFSAFKDAILKTMSEIAAGAIASVGINFLKNLIPGLNSGGSIDGYAVGGRVTGPGGPKDDKVLARLSAGEYVIQASTVNKYGKGFFDTLNSGQMPVPGFADGGFPMPDFGLPTNPISIFNTINEILRFLVGAGDNPQPYADANNQLQGVVNRYVSENVFAAMDGLVDTFGKGLIDLMIPNVTFDPRTGLPSVTREGYGTQIMNAMEAVGFPRLPGGDNRSGVNRNSDIVEGMAGLSDEFARFLFEYLAPRFASIVAPDFNMDDLVEKLFRDANGVAGGSLTLDKRQFGGPLERGQAALVGEAGPELFIPGSGGTVSPIANDGANALIGAVHEVRDEISDLRRQMSRIMAGQALAGGRA